MARGGVKKEMPRPHLIPRELLLGEPERARPTISPDGNRLAWLARDEQGVLQIRVCELAARDDGRAVTRFRDRSFATYLPYLWTWDSRAILFQQDLDGDENLHTMCLDLQSGNTRDLTPWVGVRSEWIASDPKRPDEILVALNLRNRNLMDAHRINVRSGAVSLDTINPGDVETWVADGNLCVRAVLAVTPEAGTELRIRTDGDSSWRTLISASADEILLVVDFSSDGKSVFLKSSVGADKIRVVELELASGKETVIAVHDVVDAENIVIDPVRHVIQSVMFFPDRCERRGVDDSVASDFAALEALAEGWPYPVSRNLADDRWVVALNSDRRPPQFYLWDRRAKEATFLFGVQPRLEAFPLAATEPVEFTARDGMTMRGYLTLPSGSEPRNLPMVVLVHGGPANRDFGYFQTDVQFYANRGYAVLQINFRGSSGYGKAHMKAGDRQLGLAMQADLTDGVRWAIAKGIADPNGIAIVGGSYGGFAAFAGAAFTPDLYRCAVSAFGYGNLFTLIRSFPSYWELSTRWWKKHFGDPDNPADVEILTKQSPLFSADKIKIPLLIEHGANDVRVKPWESEQMVDAIEKNGGNATYVLYSNEGHGALFHLPNRLDWYSRVEKFLAENLGGRYEPIPEEGFHQCAATVRHVGGAQQT